MTCGPVLVCANALVVIDNAAATTAIPNATRPIVPSCSPVNSQIPTSNFQRTALGVGSWRLGVDAFNNGFREDRLYNLSCDYLYRCPCLITTFGSRSTSIWRSGSPPTAMTSAYLPAAIDPLSRSAPIALAASNVIRWSTIIG